MRGKVLAYPIGPSLQTGSLSTMNDFQDKLIEESSGVHDPLVKPMEIREDPLGPRFKRRDGADGARLGDCSPPAPECGHPGLSEPVSLNAFEDITDPEMENRGKSRNDEKARVGDMKLINMFHAIDTILTPAPQPPGVKR